MGTRALAFKVVANNVQGTSCTWYCWPSPHHQVLQRPPGRDTGRKPPVEGQSWKESLSSWMQARPPRALSPSQLVAVVSSASLEKSQPWQYFLTMCLCHLKATEIKKKTKIIPTVVKDLHRCFSYSAKHYMWLVGMIHRTASGPQGMSPELDDFYLSGNPRAGLEHAERNTEPCKHLECPPSSEQQPWPPARPLSFPKVYFCSQFN